jgi:hypothetical protein
MLWSRQCALATMAGHCTVPLGAVPGGLRRCLHVAPSECTAVGMYGYRGRLSEYEKSKVLVPTQAECLAVRSAGVYVRTGSCTSLSRKNRHAAPENRQTLKAGVSHARIFAFSPELDSFLNRPPCHETALAVAVGLNCN